MASLKLQFNAKLMFYGSHSDFRIFYYNSFQFQNSILYIQYSMFPLAPNINDRFVNTRRSYLDFYLSFEM